MKRGMLFVAMAASASLLLACASILGIDDVSLRDAGVTVDASDEIAEETSTFSDSPTITDAPIEIDAGPCKVCSGISETTACALACDLPAPSSLAIDDTGSYVYFTNGGLDPNGAGSSVWKVSLAGGAAPVLLEDAGNGRPNSIAYAPARKVALYSIPGANAIRVSDGGASGASPWSGVASPSTIRIAAGGSGGVAFYKSGNALDSANVDTPGGFSSYVGEPITDYSVSVTAALVGWTTFGSPNNVYFDPVSGGAVTPLVGAQVGADHVALNNASSLSYAWSTTPSSGTAEIHSDGTGTASSTTLWTGKSVGDMKFASDDTSLYFTDSVAGTLSIIPNAAAALVIADAQDFPGQIAIAPTWVVWVNRGSTSKANGRVMRLGR